MQNDLGLPIQEKYVDHYAVMQGPWLDYIIHGIKTIESRWTKTRKTPYKMAKAGDTIYFQQAGKKVSLRAGIVKVDCFDRKTDEELFLTCFNEQWQNIGFTTCKEATAFLDDCKDIRYVTFVYLGKPEHIEPFSVNKTGYGVRAAWITIDDINKIKRTVDTQQEIT